MDKFNRKPKARVIAMYLPQYHPIPENDNVWGKGFTEWNNVAKARPLFRGHHQPNIPADLGFYDLRLSETRELQAQLAREAGVEGFMYWHYWFGNGKRLLERPFNEVLESGKPDFPFCLGWANHDWKTSTWTTMGNLQKNQMICEQTYPGEEDYIAHFNCCLKAFKDKRYIKVDGKPFFLLYDAKALPNAKQFFDLWNRLACENGFPGIHFVGINQPNDPKYKKVLNQGYDAVSHGGVWDPMQKIKGYYRMVLEKKIRDKIDWLAPIDKYNYKDFIKYTFNETDKWENVYPNIIPGWDRSPRSGKKAQIVYGSTPELWKKHCKEAVDLVQNKTFEHRIIILRSWNEWGEGNYVEPDERWGTAYLDALHEALFDE